MKNNWINISKTNRTASIMALLFFTLLVFFPQFGYAKDKVDVLDTMNMTGNQDNAKVKMVAMGFRKLESGQYQIDLLLQNTDPHHGYVTLEPSYIIKLKDVAGKVHDVEIDNQEIDYPGECYEGTLSDKECLVTLIGSTEASDVTYKSYNVTMSYRDEATDDTISQNFENDIQDIAVEHSLAMTSVTSGAYTLHINNISENKIVVQNVFLKSKCIRLNNVVTGLELAAHSGRDVSFQLNVDKSQAGKCDESVAITYKVGNDSKLKTVLVPIKINYDKDEPWYAWNNYGWMIATGAVVTVVIIGGIYLAFPAGPIIHHIIRHSSRKQIDPDDGNYCLRSTTYVHR